MPNERLTGAALVAAVRAECDRLEELEKQATRGEWQISGCLKEGLTDEIASPYDSCWIANVQRHVNCSETACGDMNARLIVSARNTFRASLEAMRTLAYEYAVQYSFMETCAEIAKPFIENGARPMGYSLNAWLEAADDGKRLKLMMQDEHVRNVRIASLRRKLIECIERMSDDDVERFAGTFF